MARRPKTGGPLYAPGKGPKAGGTAGPVNKNPDRTKPYKYSASEREKRRTTRALRQGPALTPASTIPQNRSTPSTSPAPAITTEGSGVRTPPVTEPAPTPSVDPMTPDNPLSRRMAELRPAINPTYPANPLLYKEGFGFNETHPGVSGNSQGRSPLLYRGEE